MNEYQTNKKREDYLKRTHSVRKRFKTNKKTLEITDEEEIQELSQNLNTYMKVDYKVSQVVSNIHRLVVKVHKKRLKIQGVYGRDIKKIIKP